MKIPPRPRSNNRRLTPKQIRQANEYALRLIEETGCEVQSQEALDTLAQAGCDTSNPKRVKIARKLVLEAIETAPSTIEIYNWDGESAMVLAEGSCYYGTGSDCPTTIDLSTGERRQSTKEDVGGVAAGRQPGSADGPEREGEANHS